MDGLFVYHYTDIHSLALILKSKAIRFSALSTVDDLNEAYTTDFGSLSDYIFVSCWTLYAKENIALWNMYSKDMSGIRISLPVEMFQMTRYEASDVYRKDGNGFFTMGSLYYSVIYDDNAVGGYALGIPEIKDGYRPNLLGKYKEIVWSFEQEFRYRLFGYRCEQLDGPNFNGLMRAVNSRMKPSVKFVDIPLKENMVTNMRILLGPKCVPGTEEIVAALVNTYIGGNPKDVITKSKLRIGRK